MSVPLADSLDNPPPAAAVERAAALRATLNHHAHLYYVLDAPTLPDATWAFCAVIALLTSSAVSP